MFGKLTKAAWQHPSPARRLKAIQKLNAAKDEDQHILLELALNDPDQEVANASLEAINDPITLWQALNDESSAKAVSRIKKRIARIFAEPSISVDQVRECLNKQAELAPVVVAHSNNAALRHELLEAISDSEIAHIIGEVSYVDTRALIAERLTNEADLEVARRHLKGKDKNAERLIKQKLTRLRAEKKAEDENNQAAQDLCEKMEAIAHSSEWRKEFSAQFNVFSQRWQALERKPDSDLIKRYETSCATILETLNAQEQQRQAELGLHKLVKRHKTELANLATYSLDQLIDAKLDIAQSLANLIAETNTLVTPEKSEQGLFSADQSAIQALVDLADFAQDLDAYDNDSKALSRDEIQYANALLTPHALLKNSSVRQELKARLETTKLNEQAEQQRYDRKLSELHKRISRLSSSSRKGNLHVALKELAATQKLSEAYTGHDRKNLEERLVQAQETVDKLRDWHDFATKPKFTELCEKMEALIPAKLHPDHRAQKIRQLQSQWKSLGMNDDEALWDRFKTAADKAFEPCAKFFTQRDQEREANLKKREPLVDQLARLLQKTDWQDSPDFAQVEQQLKAVHSQWLSIKNVTKDASEEQWQRYRSARESVFEKLAPEYDRNQLLKQKLVDQSERLISDGATHDSFDKLKTLQQRWKTIGITRIKEDRKLWASFKKNTDLFFQSIREFERSETQKFDDMLVEHLRIIDEIHQLSKAGEAADLQIENLEKEFAELPALPKIFPEAKLENINKRFQKALQSYQRSREQAQKTSDKEQSKRLLQKANLCSDLEAMLQKSPIDQLNIESLKAEIDALILDDAAIAKRFQTRLAGAAEQNRQAFDAARRELCIRIEIACGTDSPKPDRPLRTQIQLADMKAHGIGGQSASVEDLKLEWYCSEGASADLQRELNARVSSAFKT